jgi:hypothetical protein
VAVGVEAVTEGTYEDLGHQVRFGTSSYVSYCASATSLSFGSASTYYKLAR